MQKKGITNNENKSHFSTATSHPEMPEVKELPPEEVWANKELLTIVDVRQPEEYIGELGHIPGSRLLSLSDLADELDSLPTDKPIAFVCRSGGRSARATAFAKTSGLDAVFNMQGGMLSWNQKGLPVKKDH